MCEREIRSSKARQRQTVSSFLSDSCSLERKNDANPEIHKLILPPSLVIHFSNMIAEQSMSPLSSVPLETV